MVNKKIFSILFLLISLNIFGTENPLEDGPAWACRFESRLAQNHQNNQYLCTTIGQPVILLGGRATVSASSSNKLTTVPYGSTSLEKYVTLQLIETRFFPEIAKLREGEKNNQDDKYLDSLVASLAKKYKILKANQFNSLQYIASCNIPELRKEINSLLQKKQKIKNYISSYKQNTTLLRAQYQNISRIHVFQRSSMQKQLFNLRNDCAKTIADLSIIEDKLKYTCREMNEKVLQYSKNISKSIEQENAPKEYLSYNDILRQAIAHEKVKIAENIRKQSHNEQYRDRTFDLSGIDLKLLETQGYNKNDISNLEDANDLQDFTQKEFIHHIKENQLFRKKHGEIEFLTPLLDKHDVCLKKGLKYNKVGDTKKAMAFSDLCWRVANSIGSLAKGLGNLGEVAIEGIHALEQISYQTIKTTIGVSKDLINDFIQRPDIHMSKAIEGALDGIDSLAKKVSTVLKSPIQSIKKCFKIIDVLAHKVAMISTKSIDFCIETIENPTKAKEKIRGWNYDTCKCIDETGQYLNKIDQAEITYAVSKFTMESYLTGKAIQWTGRLVKAAYTEIAEKLKRGIQELRKANVPINIATTPEGITVAMKESEQIVDGIEKIREVVVDAKIAEELAKETIKNGFQMVGEGSVLRKINFRRGLEHSLKNHFFGNKARSLSLLDPGGNQEKWLHHIVNLAQTGNIKIARDIVEGTLIETVKTLMPKTEGGYLKIGVRLFKAIEENTWRITTILTKQ